MGQVASGMANMNIMTGGGGPDLRNQKLAYGSKFGQAKTAAQELQNTP